MNDELIEVWRKQFEDAFLIDGCLFCQTQNRYRNNEGSFEAHNTNIRYMAWLRAKGSQKVVELPKDYGNGKVEMKSVQKALTAAGIQFKVKE